ncbi:extracellular solute-binding protein family 3 [Pseudodesulfovibrio mercurii]|uniref:Extracellular solute-binding protein family 3 n=1 Tax=Pseudodesulfovibrio mercurii TaxID=641491 RepID=F0JFG0_9BACT|nr:transporter substrate-binding domain-containing protein [Pseudodesulfovibrio mercurii]EGB14884.1 extracellular solute-binding protein family 3 [Pseudodesulfovibrio mercurii]
MPARQPFSAHPSANAPGASRPGPLAALLLCALLLLPATGRAGSPAVALMGYTWLTEEYYPFNYTENGRIKGVSADLLRMVWDELGIPPQTIESMPWARAFERMEHEPGIVLFCMARTPEREHAFRWAGPIAQVRFALIARKDRHVRMDSLDDIKGLSVGTLREDISDTLLADYRGTASIQPVAHMHQNISKLMTNRLDLVAYEETSWRKIAARHDLDPDAFETVYVLRETPVYYAFRADTPAEVVAAFQAALDRVKARPAYQRLLDAYLR